MNSYLLVSFENEIRRKDLGMVHFFQSNLLIDQLPKNYKLSNLPRVWNSPLGK